MHWGQRKLLLSEIEFLTNLDATIVGDRRKKGALGLNSGGDGLPARDTHINIEGQEHILEGPIQINIKKGERIRIETPGGGGWSPINEEMID